MSLNNWKGQSEDLVIEIDILSLEYICRVAMQGRSQAGEAETTGDE
jgi:hypothetical protein